MELEKYSLGIGDRFGREGRAQLRALQKAEAAGVRIAPVWNKSNREHTIIGTTPRDTRREADDAVRANLWTGPYYVDADHISLTTVDRFLDSSNFFTIDVADMLGKPVDRHDAEEFVVWASRFKGSLSIPSMAEPVVVTEELLGSVAQKYLAAVKESGRVYRYVKGRIPSGDFVTEFSVDETAAPQSPAELLFILAAIAREGIPIRTIAPKFSGSFLKGIDYVGSVEDFARELEDDLAVIAYAVPAFGLPLSLKLSIHSGSDKFSLYPVLHRAIERSGAGLHLKTAGTTWLEEVIGLAEGGGEGLRAAKEIYAGAYRRYNELAPPYRSVIEIDKSRLPLPEEVNGWSSAEFVEALRHDRSCPRFSVHFRQLVHIGYKVAAEMGERFRDLLNGYREPIEANVTANLFTRHICPLFLGSGAPPGSSR